MTQDVQKILQEIKENGHKKVKLAITDIDGILRGKYIHISKFESAIEDGFGFCDVVLGWDSEDACYDSSEKDFTGWHKGFPDTPVKIDFSTYRKVPWDNDVPFFLLDFGEKGNDLDLCPRGLLKKIRDQALGMGYESIFAQEFEWFNFKEDPNELHDRNFQNLNPLTRGMFGYSLLRASKNNDFFNDLFDKMYDFNVPIEGLHTETGPGVYEAAILYNNVLESADRATLFKTATKEIGMPYGIMPTFMAKWNSDLPGCSGHVHQSLWSKGKNVFVNSSDTKKLTPIMEHYIAGLLHCLPEILPLYAPTVNSYKRLVEGLWAPTTLTWGIDNRTTAVRALPGGEKSSRLEMRVPGSDVNPYLAMAGCLASGLYGIKHQLALKTPETIGNAYEEKSFGTLPKDLSSATDRMDQSSLARELFGENFVNHFVKTRKWEWMQYSKAVTDWEMRRYFEII